MLLSGVEGVMGLGHPHTEAAFLFPRWSGDMLDCFTARQSILLALRSRLWEVEGTVLDIGCGYMPYKPLFLAAPSRATRYVGLDLVGPIYKASPDVVWDGLAMPFGDETIDCAIATEVFEHCPDPEIVMREACRVLKPDGWLFFTVPFLWPLHDVPHDHYRYTPFALERHLRRAGFGRLELAALGGWDASLGQMIGLWARRRPMAGWKRSVLSTMMAPVVRYLVRRDVPPDRFGESCMITGLCGTAYKPRV